MKKKCILFGVVALMLVGCGDSKESIDLSNSVSEGKTSSSINTPSSVDAPSHANSVSESETSSSVSAPDTSSSLGSNSLGSTTPSTPSKETFLITFNDENGNLLEAKEWEVDLIPYYNYDKEDTAEWDYTFEGWSESLNGPVITIPAVTKSATYYAVVSSTKQKYNISFYDEEGNKLTDQLKEYGEIPSYNYNKEDTLEWDYNFEGWSKTLGGEALSSLPVVTGPASYYAIVSVNKQKYNISFYDEEGNKLSDITKTYGEVPSYNYDKADTAEWDYTFEGWSTILGGEVLPTLPMVTSSASYYAVISKVKKQYTITFDSNDGTAVSSITDEYGSLIDEPTKPTKDGYSFVSWCTDATLTTAVTWPITLTENKTYYAKWNEKVDIKKYLKALIDAIGQDPYSYIPNTMRPTNADNLVTAEEVNYDFTSFTNVNSIKYGGFGEQWQMVMDNIAESERFYTILTLADSVISASVVAFNNWFDKNPSDTNKEIAETGYYAKVDFSNFVLTYTIQLKTGFTIPLFGEVIPQIDMTYNIITSEKSVRVNLSDSNAMRYLITDNEYLFGIEYGINNVTRSAYCQLTRDVVDNSVQGHIYEYISLKDSDVVKSCADFYINDTYTSVIGNKASGIKLMDGYINELYKTSEGKLLGYKVQETKTVVGMTGTYHTLWFNLNSISGISSVKVTDKSKDNDNSYNANDIYINNSSSLFTPTYNKLLVRTSRKYDIELRTQYRYGYENSELTCYKTSIPMMFIQDDHDGYTNYSDFAKDIKAQNGITASVTLSSRYLEKIRYDYDLLIPVFKENKEHVNSDIIVEWIGTVIK
ncbi:MAG: InlB B-repeat-containing protein [Erysipelotrichales bacterium]|nr:InlB B-repeat-containing protein [Erysipelotrichales bacterium]